MRVRMPMEARMNVGSSGSGVVGGSEQPDMVLGSKPGSSGRAANMLCCQLISSAPIFCFFKTGPHCSSG